MVLFLRQIRYEIKNILKSKFILIIGILMLVSSIAVPTLSFFSQRSRDDSYFPQPRPIWSSSLSYVAYDGAWSPEAMEEEPIIIDGVTINYDNPFYWQLKGLMDEKQYMESDKGRFSSSEVLDLALLLMDEEQKFYVNLAKHITEHRDYRMELSWSGMSNVYDKFIYEHNDVEEDKLFEAVSYRRGFDEESFKEKYIDITPEERLRALDQTEEKLNTLYQVVENNDFPQFIDLRIKQEEDNIEDLKEQIEVQERLIIENPSQEEWVSDYIEQLKKQIEMIETNNIPTLEYRLEKNIIPGEDIWQNTALSQIEMYRNELLHREIRSEEEFNKDMYLIQEYKTYQRYVKAMEAERDEISNKIIIAQRSLEADKPDMKFVPSGARSKTFNFLSYATFVAMFAILVGGWLMASEFQQGTIRLLMIRPKTRTKILMSKFIGAFIITIAIYILGTLFNLITNGAFFGFSDFAYPNFTISGEIDFFSYYLPKSLACTVPIIFAYALAFLLSVLIRNAAVAIIIPMAFFIGSYILSSIFIYGNKAMHWIAYTPIPYLELSSYFSEYSNIAYALRRGIPLSFGYGIGLLLVLSAIFAVLSIVTFKRRDITN